jgi:hypothetical protein
MLLGLYSKCPYIKHVVIYVHNLCLARTNESVQIREVPLLTHSTVVLQLSTAVIVYSIVVLYCYTTVITYYIRGTCISHRTLSQ